MLAASITRAIGDRPTAAGLEFRFQQHGVDCTRSRGKIRHASWRRAFITHPDCLKHDMGAHHPERPRAAHRDRGPADRLRARAAPGALRSAARDRRAARARASARVRARDPRRRARSGHRAPRSRHGDEPVHACDAALRAAGAAVLATDLVMRGKADSAFCARAPAGPPRLPRAADGLLHLQQRRRRRAPCASRRTASSAWRSSISTCTTATAPRTSSRATRSVLMASTFQHPFYPYSGTEDPAPNMVNVPLAAGSGSRQFREAVARGLDAGAGRLPARS